MIHLRHLLFILLLASTLTSCAQGGNNGLQPQTDTISITLGERQVKLLKSTYGTPQPYTFLQLHDNEATGEEAAIDYLQQNGGVLLSIENGGERNVIFNMNGQTFTFDPNRIFTPDGLLATLQKFGNTTPEAIAAVDSLAKTILQHLPDSAWVIAIHNNTDEAFSAMSYCNDTTYQKDAAELYISDEYDVDDFFLTTEKYIFDSMAHLEYNVVLQDNMNAADDGSLSVYYGKKGVRYVNVEAQHGNRKVQRKMIEDLMNVLLKKN